MNKKNEEQIKVLKGTVGRNKIRNTGVSVDKIVSVLMENNISLHSVNPTE